jgi:hypothetical protein
MGKSMAVRTRWVTGSMLVSRALMAVMAGPMTVIMLAVAAAWSIAAMLMVVVLGGTASMLIAPGMFGVSMSVPLDV